MASKANAPEVKFSTEAREPTPAQLDAGRRFFGQLLAKARAEKTSASRPAGERGQRGQAEQSDKANDPPHLLTGGSQTP